MSYAARYSAALRLEPIQNDPVHLVILHHEVDAALDIAGGGIGERDRRLTADRGLALRCTGVLALVLLDDLLRGQALCTEHDELHGAVLPHATEAEREIVVPLGGVLEVEILGILEREELGIVFRERIGGERGITARFHGAREGEAACDRIEDGVVRSVHVAEPAERDIVEDGVQFHIDMVTGLLDLRAVSWRCTGPSLRACRRWSSGLPGRARIRSWSVRRGWRPSARRDCSALMTSTLIRTPSGYGPVGSMNRCPASSVL